MTGQVFHAPTLGAGFIVTIAYESPDERFGVLLIRHDDGDVEMVGFTRDREFFVSEGLGCAACSDCVLESPHGTLYLSGTSLLGAENARDLARALFLFTEPVDQIVVES